MAEKLAFEDVSHIAFILSDISQSVKYYELLGFGPFTSLQLPAEIVGLPRYAKHTTYKTSSLYTSIGESPIGFEFIQPSRDALICYDYLKKKGQGVHHIAFKVADVESEAEKLQKNGFKVILEQTMTSRIKIVYVESSEAGGVVFELWQPPIGDYLPQGKSSFEALEFQQPDKTREQSSFNKLDHIGVIVRDVDKAAAFYESLGMGPFKTINFEFQERRVRGKLIAADSIKLKEKIGKAGQLMIQFLQPIKGEGFWKDFLEIRGEGIQHLAFHIDDIDEEETKMAKKGINVINKTRIKDNGGTIYLDTSDKCGIIFELLDFHWALG